MEHWCIATEEWSSYYYLYDVITSLANTNADKALNSGGSIAQLLLG